MEVTRKRSIWHRLVQFRLRSLLIFAAVCCLLSPWMPTVWLWAFPPEPIEEEVADSLDVYRTPQSALYIELTGEGEPAAGQGGNVRSSDYYMGYDDDLQYFPDGLEFKLSREAAGLRESKPNEVDRQPETTP